MTERAPDKVPVAQEALRESHREKIRQRLLWLKPTDQEGFRAMVHVMAVDAGYELSAENDFLDHMIDDPLFADRVAVMFDVATEDLVSTEFISQEDFVTQNQE